MRSPFPGMDPYLEHRAIWPDVHNSLITAIRDEIAPQIAPKYFTRVESRAYIVRSSDQRYLGCLDLSVASKPPGHSRQEAEPAYVVNSNQDQSDQLIVDIALLPPQSFLTTPSRQA